MRKFCLATSKKILRIPDNETAITIKMVDKKIIFSTSNILPTNDMTTRRKFGLLIIR